MEYKEPNLVRIKQGGLRFPDKKKYSRIQQICQIKTYGFQRVIKKIRINTRKDLIFLKKFIIKGNVEGKGG